MPEIKIKHVVSFSSEDKVHKAENLIKPETYRKWKCATPGEKSATVVLQFEKATQINSIDIGNENSAFVEVLVGRSSDTTNDFQVLLVASSFMSPMESRNGTHLNRVRMFGPEKLSQSTKDEKWDCVQIVCTQPFNKTVTYGLSFIKFHSPSEKNEELSEKGMTSAKLGAFKLKFDDDEDDESLLTSGSWFEKQKTQSSQSSTSSTDDKTSYASVVLASSSNTPKVSAQVDSQKRKIDDIKSSSNEPPAKKASIPTLNKGHIVYKDILRDVSENEKLHESNDDLKKNISSPKPRQIKKPDVTTPTSSSKPSETRKPVVTTPTSNSKPSETRKPVVTTPVNKRVINLNQRVPFDEIMDRVVFVLSGFVNPLRSELRDKALEMGARYKGDWDSSCTHLVCAFINTPKYQQVEKLQGRIVSKEWILDCYKKKNNIPWTKYMLSKSSGDSSESDYSEEESDDSEEEFKGSDEEYTDKKKKKNTNNNVKVKNKPPYSKNTQTSTPNRKIILKSPSKDDQPNAPTKTLLNTSNSKNQSGISTKKDNLPTSIKKNTSDTAQLHTIKDESETDDEEALQDYMADTDHDDDSGGDTEDELRKFEMRMQKNGGSPSKKTTFSKEDSESTEKPDVTNLPLPGLLNLFKQKHFFLFGKISPSKQHDMQRYIIAYNGIMDDYMSDKVKYVITEAKWDKNFEDAVSENEDLIFVKPTWIYKCHDAQKLVPYQPYIVIPDSEN